MASASCAATSGTVPHPSPASTTARNASWDGRRWRGGETASRSTPRDARNRSCRVSCRSNATSRAPDHTSGALPGGRCSAAKAGAATARYRIDPSGRTAQPCTGEESAVTAAITVPSRKRSAVRSWSTRCTSTRTRSGSPASAAGNQVDNESALTARGTVDGNSSPSSPRASRSRRVTWPARRTRTCPATVARVGLALRTSTCPAASSSALIRWLTADGVTCRVRAAASNEPCRTTAARVASCSVSNTMKTLSCSTRNLNWSSGGLRP